MVVLPDGYRGLRSALAARVAEHRVWKWLTRTALSARFTKYSLGSVVAFVASNVAFAAFYVMTGLATIAFYRRRIISNAWDLVLVGILPFAAAGFLIWIIYRSIQQAPASQNWSLVGIVALGLVLLFIARFVMRSAYFQLPREAASKDFTIFGDNRTTTISE